MSPKRTASAALLAGVAAALVCLAVLAPWAGEAGGQLPGDGAPSKFDHGFYDKIQALIKGGGDDDGGAPQPRRVTPDEDLEYVIPAADSAATRDGPLYYHVIMAIGGDGGAEIRRNMERVVDAIEAAGGREIVSGGVMPFVTALVPVQAIPALSLHEGVSGLGDGELPTTPDVDRARQTVRATPANLAGLSGGAVNGSNVTVAVMDFGINSAFLNGKVASRIYCPGGSCGFDGSGHFFGSSTLTPDQIAVLNGSVTGHGAKVAQIIAASGMAANNGLAPGVQLLDGYSNTSADLINALIWAHGLGARVVNISLNISALVCEEDTTVNKAINEAVVNGMVVVTSAGNDGYVSNGTNSRFLYGTPKTPACAHNTITVGGINDRGQSRYLYASSSKGPLNNTLRLAPHLVTPAESIQLQRYTTVGNDFTGRFGTSYAAPVVSAAAALMLDLKPDLAPAETRALLLLGADWSGPVPCTSTQYEISNSTDNCSHAARQAPSSHPRTLTVLNHAGFGVLDAAESLGYVDDFAVHVDSNSTGPGATPKIYGLNVTRTADPVKVVLSWLALNGLSGLVVPDLDFTVVCPGSSNGMMRAESDQQTTEFVVFRPSAAGTCTVRVDGSGTTSPHNYTLATTHTLDSAPSEIALAGTVSASGDGDYLTGDTIYITVSLSDPVLVGAANPPYLWLDMAPADRRANYTGGSGGSDLYFEYVVQADDTAADLGYIGTGALVAPDANSIREANANITVRPVLPSPGAPGSLSFNQEINVNPPPQVPGTPPPQPPPQPPPPPPPRPTSPPPPPPPLFLPLPAAPPPPPPDTLPPVVVSIEGADPPGNTTDRRTLVFNVTFSEPVSGVDRTDFVLSRDSGPQPLEHRSSPALVIPGLQAANDTIAVGRPGAVASVTVGLNITHLVTSGLTVQLAAPDGTTRLLHNGTFAFGGGIFGTYRPDFNGTESSGNWTLTVRNGLIWWNGTLNGWNLTISHDTAAPAPLHRASAPALGIAAPEAALDTITVGRSGIAESVAVGVNITHASAGDLMVELVPPAGPGLVLHNRTAGSAAGLAATYAPDIAGIDISGNWTLRVLDGAGAYNGTLNSWSLAINHTHIGLVAGLSGSGSTYLVTVLAAQNGTYNIDIAPDSGIADEAGNLLAHPAIMVNGTDHTYTVRTPPPGAAPVPRR